MSSAPPINTKIAAPKEAYEIVTPPSTTGSDWESLTVQILTTRVKKILIRENPNHDGEKPTVYILTAGIPKTPGHVEHHRPTLLVNDQTDVAPAGVRAFCDGLNRLTEGRIPGSVIPWPEIMRHMCAMNDEKGICGFGCPIRHIECTWLC